MQMQKNIPKIKQIGFYSFIHMLYFGQTNVDIYFFNYMISKRGTASDSEATPTSVCCNWKHSFVLEQEGFPHNEMRRRCAK